MALAFATSPDAPVQCALEISKALKSHPELRVRMGIHSGPVSGLVDVNDRSNIAGAGINMAQRVMDCGDAGHILLSRHIAEDLDGTRSAAIRASKALSASPRGCKRKNWHNLSRVPQIAHEDPVSVRCAVMVTGNRSLNVKATDAWESDCLGKRTWRGAITCT